MSDWYSNRDDHKAVLPKEGERLEFGVHRLEYSQRPCPALTGKSIADKRYDALLRAAKKDPAYILAVCARQNERAEKAAEAARWAVAA
jgi:hypothetical protein